MPVIYYNRYGTYRIFGSICRSCKKINTVPVAIKFYIFLRKIFAKI
jgi:hypothetical protein